MIFKLVVELCIYVNPDSRTGNTQMGSHIFFAHFKIGLDYLDLKVHHGS
jgi:hypothetical protein